VVNFERFVMERCGRQETVFHRATAPSFRLSYIYLKCGSRILKTVWGFSISLHRRQRVHYVSYERLITAWIALVTLQDIARMENVDVEV
jgi:hypothetical protein